ncbi:hypothetical protein [Arthrobacter sp. AL12]|uniref:hypothetical protein n=1 Tax=Arthrobacter sp. AL12 TaxID=3042241 RepID=UPI00249B487B|nr:hypothetical protein [Arthrobacter sp. AL12]MDI3211795.1 hypothetical protein [Arthrobacter sp. AL12]
MNQPNNAVQEELKKKIVGTLLFHTGWDDLSTESPEVRDWLQLIEAETSRREQEAVKRFADDIYPDVTSAFMLNENHSTNSLLKTVEAALNANLPKHQSLQERSNQDE